MADDVINPTQPVAPSQPIASEADKDKQKKPFNKKKAPNTSLNDKAKTDHTRSKHHHLDEYV